MTFFTDNNSADPATLREIAASANRIDMIIAVFAFGVILGTLIA